MLWLIDGYNLMYAMGAISGKEPGPEAFRRKRRRFLNVLADALGASGPGRQRWSSTPIRPRPTSISSPSFKGLTLIFALGDENADARIEQLIAQHSAPKSLTVVSTDRRIRRAAARRKARAMTAEEFLDLIERPPEPETTGRGRRGTPLLPGVGPRIATLQR